MDIKSLPVSAKPLSTLLCSVALGFTFFSFSSNAEQFVCDATQASEQQLPLLAQSCPIGEGLWGKQQPKGSESMFWIQCGVLAKPLSIDEAKVIYQKISTDVWGKIEGKNVRCLIGPYQDFAQATKEQQAVKTLKQYKQAFIREVVKENQLAAVGKPVTKPVSVLPVESTAMTAKKQATTIIAVPKPSVKAKPQVAAVVSKPVDTKILIRREALVNGIQFKVPYTVSSDEQFYMEHELPWNRMDFDGAAKLCQRLDMQLPNAEQWQNLLNERLMVSEQWPIHLPYWGAERTGLFTSGKTNQINGTSLLNVMCVK